MPTPTPDFSLDEPALALAPDGRLFMVMRRPTSPPYETRTADLGHTWDPPQPSQLTAAASPAGLLRLNNSHLLLRIWNNATAPYVRDTLSIASSPDHGATWLPAPPKPIFTAAGIETTAAYPSMVQTGDGNILLAYHADFTDGNSKGIALARFNAEWVTSAAPTPPPFAVSLTAAPQAAGAPITLLATARGGNGPIHYQFLVDATNGATVITSTVLQDYSPASTCTWTPPQAGNYYLRVHARDDHLTVSTSEWCIIADDTP